MGLRRTSIRVRVFLLVLIPLLALIGIYTYAVAGEIGTASGLASAGDVSGATITPVSKVMVALNAERGIAVEYLGSKQTSLLAEYRAGEAATDASLRVVEMVSASGPVTANASQLEKAAAAQFLGAVRALPELRSQVAARLASPDSVILRYSAMVTAGIQVIAQSLQETYVSQPIATTARQEVNLYESEMLVLQESDLYTNAVLTGRLSPADQMAFGQLAGLRRYLVQNAVPQLDAVASGLYQQYVPARLSATLATLEDKVIQLPPGVGGPPVPLRLWQGTVRSYATNLEIMLTKGPNWIQSQVTSSARGALVTLIVAASLGLLAVITSVVISVLMGRRLVRRLTSLRESVLRLAHDQLPGLIGRLRDGERVDVDAEAPPAEASADEIDQLRQAFGVVHRAAVEAAVGEANLRRGLNEVFRNLAKRSQLLLHRQLGILDEMERRAGEPEELADLFRIDHLTTRMQRHAEGLIILSGGSSARVWRQPVPFIDVLRGAVAEVEDYTRVRVEVRSRAALVGHAVADVIHLLAELIENATAFSPPATAVLAQGVMAGGEFVVEVEDRGLGIPSRRLAEMNRDLASHAEFDLSRSDRLGLFTVGRLARRHGITVRLRASAYGGTTAEVVVPPHLVTGQNAGPAGGAAATWQAAAAPQPAPDGIALDAAAADQSPSASVSVGATPESASGVGQEGGPTWRARPRIPGRHAAVNGPPHRHRDDGHGPDARGSDEASLDDGRLR